MKAVIPIQQVVDVIVLRRQELTARLQNVCTMKIVNARPEESV